MMEGMSRHRRSSSIRATYVLLFLAFVSQAAALSVTARTPANNGASIAVDVTLRLEFDVKPAVGSGSIEVYKSDGTLSGSAIDVTSGSVSITSKAASITLSTNLDHTTSYYVIVQAGTFREQADPTQEFAGYLSTTSWVFTTVDLTSPTFTYSPTTADQLASVPLVLTFSENVQVGAGNVIVYDSDGELIQSISASASDISISGNIVTVTLPTTLAEKTDYYVTVSEGSFEDLSFNACPALAANTWTFSVGDFTAPGILSTTPAFGLTAITAYSMNFLLTFDEQVTKTASCEAFFYENNILLETVGTSLITMSTTTDSTGATVSRATINPVTNMQSTKTYFIVFNAGAFEDTATSPNQFAGISAGTWQFETLDEQSPILLSRTPAFEATNIRPSNSLRMVFDETVVTSAFGNILLTPDTGSAIFISCTDASVTVSGNTEVIVDLSAHDLMPDNDAVDVTVGQKCIKDEYDNFFTGLVDTGSWNYTTGDYTAPILSSTSPSNGDTNVQKGDNIILFFNEAIQLSSSDSVLIRFKYYNDAAAEVTEFTVSATSSEISASGSQVTIDPTSFLTEYRTYDIAIDSGFVSDVSVNNNPYSGMSLGTWTFTVKDTTPPHVVSLNPPHLSTGIPSTSNFTIEFNENVFIQAGTIRFYDLSGGLIEDIGTPSVSQVTGGGTQFITINPSLLIDLTSYYIEISANSLADDLGNDFMGLHSPGNWTITTSDISAPSLVALTPYNTFTQHLAADDLALEFDENVRWVDGKGSVIVREYDTDTQIAEIFPNTTADTYTGSLTAYIVAIPALVEQVTYWVEIPAGAISDYSGNEFAGFSTKAGWSFTVKDETPPVLDSTIPSSGATNVLTTSGISLNFNENILWKAGSINVTRVSTGEVIATFNPFFGADSGTITGNGTSSLVLTPDVAWTQGDVLEVTIAPYTIDDTAVNSYAGTSFSFTVIDTTSPIAVKYVPQIAASNVHPTTELVVQFDETVQVVSPALSVSVIISGTGATVSFTLDGTVSANNVSLSTALSLSDETIYYVTVSSAGITDLSDNQWSTSPSVSSDWYFTTGDFTAPTVVTRTPAHSATQVGVNADLILDFSENIAVGTGLISIVETVSGTTFETIDITSVSGTVSVSGTTLTLNPVGTFTDLTNYYVTIPATAIIDTSTNANNFAGYLTTTNWRFTTTDTVAPTVVTYTPPIQATNVDPTADLVLDFTDDMQVGTSGVLYIHQSSDDAVYASIDIPSAIGGTTAISATTVTINPGLDLQDQTQYWIQIEDGALQDTYSNNYAGLCSTCKTWNFTTGDYTNPTLTTLSPFNGEDNISPTPTITMTFDENVAINSGTSNIIISRSDGTGTSTSYPCSSLVIATNTASLTLSVTLTDLIDYYIQVPADCIADASLNSNTYPGFTDSSSWTFTVGDFTAPTPTAYSPTGTGAATDSSLQITFSEAVFVGTTPLTFRVYETATNSLWWVFTNDNSNTTYGSTSGFGGQVITLNPGSSTVSLNELTEYYVLMEASAFQDLAGNQVAAISSTTEWTFTTGDFTAPLATAFSPVNNDINVAKNEILTITFNELVQSDPSFGPISIYSWDGSTATLHGDTTLQFSDSPSTISGSNSFTISITHPTEFLDLTTYYVTIGSSVIMDSSTNNYVGIADSTTWRFTTGDFTQVQVTTLSPFNGETGVSIQANCSMTFSEAVTLNTGLVRIYAVLHDGSSQVFSTISVDNPNLGGGFAYLRSSTELVLVPSNDFQGSTYVDYYYVDIVDAEIVLDSSNNTLTIPSEWRFTTEDVTAPTSPTYNPISGSVNVATSTTLDLTFSEDVILGSVGSLYITRVSDGAVTTINVDGSTPLVGSGSASGAIISFTLVDSLLDEVQYSITIDDGAITDTSGNAYVQGTTEWSFTTGDFSSPTVITKVPYHTETGVSSLNSYVFEIQFSENVRITTSNVDSSLRLTIHFSSNDVQADEFVYVDSTKSTFGDGTTNVTFTFGSSLSDNTQYYILIPTGMFYDDSVNSNEFAGYLANEWEFTTGDWTNPFVQSYSPSLNAASVDTSTDLVLGFNEVVIAQTGNTISLHYQSDDTEIESWDAANATIVSGSSSTDITFNPTVTLPDNTAIYVLIPGAAFTDTSGNTFAGLTTTTSWYFTTGDYTIPYILGAGYNPVNGATEIDLDVSIQATFNENVIAGTGYIHIKEVSTGNTFVSVLTTDASMVQFSSTEMIVVLTGLSSSTEYYVEIDSDAVQDVNGNFFPGITGSTTWAWTTKDTVGPLVTVLDPSIDSTGVAAGTSLTVTFDEIAILTTASAEAVDISITWSGGLYTVSTDPSDLTDDGIATGSGTTQITIDLSTDLPDGTLIFVSIPADAVRDVNGNSFLGLTSTWSFTIIDTVAPVLLSVTPADGSIGVSTSPSVLMEFDEEVTFVTSSISFIPTAGGTSVSIGPSATTLWATSISGSSTYYLELYPTLVDLTEYYVSVNGAGAITDTSGNQFGTLDGLTYPWAFTTADKTAPSVTSRTPSPSSVGVAVTANLVIVFDEEVIASTGGESVKIYNPDGSVKETITVSFSSQVTTVYDNITDTTTVTLNPNDDLLDSTTYTITVDAGAFVDTATSPNSFEGYAFATTDWIFTTIDTTAPVLTSHLPLDGATDVAVASNLTLTFDEIVYGGTGTLVLTHSGGTVGITMDDAGVTGVGTTTLVVNLASNLGDLVLYDVTIGSDAIYDASGNYYTGMTTGTWTFTTGDYTIPSLVTVDPNYDETGVGKDVDLVFTFSESVQFTTGVVSVIQLSNNETVEDIDITLASHSSGVVTVPRTVNLADLTTYYVVILPGVITDLADNDYSGLGYGDYKFTVGDFTPPVVNVYFPAQSDTNVNTSTYLQVQFDEDVTLITSPVKYFTITLSDSTVVTTIASTSMTSSTNTVTVETGVTLQDKTDYIVVASTRLVDDLDGNSALSFSWSWTTGDYSGPTTEAGLTYYYNNFAIGSLYPNDIDSCLPQQAKVDAGLIMTFNEDVMVGNGYVSIYHASDGTLFERIDVTSSQVTTNGAEQVYIATTTDFNSATAYYVLVQGTCFLDTSVNTNYYNAITSTSTWYFTTMSPPSSLSYTPSAQNVSISVAMTTMIPSSSGDEIQSYSISPLLPAGLSLDSSTGIISGTATEITSYINYTIVARNNGGTATASIQIRVKDTPPSGLSYTYLTSSYSRGVAITSNSPSYYGGTPTNYYSNPTLPSGLTLDATTGVISGTPSVNIGTTVFTITAENSGGSTTASVTITVTTGDVIIGLPNTISNTTLDALQSWASTISGTITVGISLYEETYGLDTLESGSIDILNMKAVQAYVAYHNFGYQVVATEAESTGSTQYAITAMVLASSGLTAFSELSGLRACLGGFLSDGMVMSTVYGLKNNATSTLNVPDTADMTQDIASCDSPLATTVQEYYSGICAPPETEREVGVCSICPITSSSPCDDENLYAGADGALRGLSIGACDVAMVRETTYDTYCGVSVTNRPTWCLDSADLSILQEVDTGDGFGLNPSDAFMIRSYSEWTTAELSAIQAALVSLSSISEAMDFYDADQIVIPGTAGTETISEAHFDSTWTTPITKWLPGLDNTLDCASTSTCSTSDQSVDADAACENASQLGQSGYPIKFGLPPSIDADGITAFNNYFSLIQELTGLYITATTAASTAELELGEADVVEMTSMEALIAYIRYGHVAVAVETLDSSLSEEAAAVPVMLERYSEDIVSFSQFAGMRSCHASFSDYYGTILPITYALNASLTSESELLGTTYWNRTIDACDSPVVGLIRDFFEGSCAPPAYLGEAGVCDLCPGTCDDSNEYYGEAGALKGLSEYACEVAFVSAGAWEYYCTGEDAEEWCLPANHYAVLDGIELASEPIASNAFMVRRNSLSSDALTNLHNALTGLTHQPELLSYLRGKPLVSVDAPSSGTYGTLAATESHLGAMRDYFQYDLPGLSELIDCYGTGGGTTNTPTSSCPLTAPSTCASFSQEDLVINFNSVGHPEDPVFTSSVGHVNHVDTRARETFQFDKRPSQAAALKKRRVDKPTSLIEFNAKDIFEHPTHNKQSLSARVVSSSLGTDTVPVAVNINLVLALLAIGLVLPVFLFFFWFPLKSKDQQ